MGRRFGGHRDLWSSQQARNAQRQTAKLHKWVARQREDTGRKWAERVAHDHDPLAVEDLRPPSSARSTMPKKAADAAIGATKRSLIEVTPPRG
ncbi:hypothetical protein ACFYXH_41910 [Streptomyces sp. NPDC002730]|uniref:hypothetical protein n=1 Tax=Streptomyces sp. NPDC002730 TaxID=3364662 RepID=UPI00369ED33D